jgi:hypothetical protein
MREPTAMTASPQDCVVLDAAVPEQRTQWLAVWDASPHRDVVAHPAYAELFARAEDRTVCACQTRPDGAILFPLILRPLRAEAWARAEDACDLVSPYGYGGPFGWGAYEAEAFWSEFDRWAQTVHAVSLFVRLSLFEDHLIPFKGDTVVKGPAVVVPLDLPADRLLASYDNAARKNVRQAERAGVTIEVDRGCRRLDDFLGIYYSTMDRLEARPMYYFPRTFFDALLNSLPEQPVLFHALHGGRVLSTELLLVSKDYLYSFLNGTAEEGMPVRANPLLRHAVNLWAHAQGKRYVLLGGGYEAAEDSLFRYKQRYAPKRRQSFCVGTRILDRTSYQRLVDRRAAWERAQGRPWWPLPDFFPAYRGVVSALASVSQAC